MNEDRNLNQDQLKSILLTIQQIGEQNNEVQVIEVINEITKELSAALGLEKEEVTVKVGES